MALGVLISSFPYFGVPTLSQVFGYYAAPSAVQIQRIQISAQTLPVGGNITVALINQAGTSYGAGAQATLYSGNGYVDVALAAPITLSPGQVVRAIITEVDSGVAQDLTINLVGATAEGTPVPSGCGNGGGQECAPPAAQLLFFKGSVAQEVQAAAASAAAAATSATAAAGSATAAGTSASSASGSATAAANSATAAAAQTTLAAGYATNANNAATASAVYAGQSQASATAAAASAAAAAASAQGASSARVGLAAASTQTIADATPTKVSWDNFQFDDNSFWNIANPTRLTIPAGVTRVRLTAGIRWTPNVTGERQLRIIANPAGTYDANSVFASDDRPSDNSGDATLDTGILVVTAGMYFELEVEQNSGAPLDILTTSAADNRANFFCIQVLKSA